MGFTYNRDGAMKAGSSDFIQESGVYIGKFSKAYETVHQSGAVSITFEFVSNEGLKSDYLRIITQKKDGDEAFGANHIYALMGLLKIENANPVMIDEEHSGYPMFCNKPIGVILQRENKEDGKFQMNILHFINPITRKTMSEQENGEEAKEAKKEIKDKNSSGKKSADPLHGFNDNSNNKQGGFDPMFDAAPQQQDQLADDLPF